MRAIVIAGTLLLGGLGVFAQRMGPVTPEWTAVLPVVRETVGKEFPMPESPNPVKISTTADVTGDGTPEALIDLGCCGAYTDDMTVMRMEDGKPVLALFRGKDGKVSTMLFSDGASVMHGAAVQMIRTEHAVFSAVWNMNDDGTKMHDCGGEAFRWDTTTKVFTFDQRLSAKLSREFCKERGAALSKQGRH